MTDKKENSWIKFVPSLNLPKERVSIAYDTHDERCIRYAYGYFQFYNGTCGCFWKDGNEQPKVIKAEDIKYWMPVPSLDVQEEPVSEKVCMYSKDNYTDEDRKALCEGCEEECKFNKKEYSVSEDLEEAVNAYIGYAPEVDESSSTYGKRQAFKAGAKWQKEQDQSTIELAEDHAMLAGMEKMKEQMMAKAVDGKIYETQARSKLKAVTTGNLSRLDYKVGDKVKVIVIKGD